MIDLSVCLLAHRESVLLGPTMRSTELAIAAAEKEGIAAELIMGLDNCEDATRAFLNQPRFNSWTRHDFQLKDQGKVRNALAELATGRYLAFLDADDLYSENWLVEAVLLLRAADETGQKRIAHPELNWLFDSAQSLLVIPSQDDPLYCPEYLLVSNCYDALCVAPRQVYLDHPYADRAVAQGYAYEDWQWALETTAAGWVHVPVRDTIIFKRRRDVSQTRIASDAKVQIRQIRGTAIDEIDLITPAREITGEARAVEANRIVK